MVRRFLAAASALAVIALSGLVLSTSASAAPYPPTPTPSLSASAYDPCAGAANVLLGNGFQPGETVTLVLGGNGELGRATVGPDGTFTITVNIPLSARGTEVVTATGLTSGLVARVSLAFPCVLGQNATSIGGGSGSLAYTGVAIGGVLLLGAALVGGGALLTAASRRRRGATT